MFPRVTVTVTVTLHTLCSMEQPWFYVHKMQLCRLFGKLIYTKKKKKLTLLCSKQPTLYASTLTVQHYMPPQVTAQHGCMPSNHGCMPSRMACSHTVKLKSNWPINSLFTACVNANAWINLVYPDSHRKESGYMRLCLTGRIQGNEALGQLVL